MRLNILLFFGMYCAFYPSVSWSNGWMDESSFLKSGDLKITKKARLISESVRFVLEPDKFHTEVRYKVESEGSPLDANLFFPVLCKTADPNREVDSISDTPCVSNFRVLLDKNPITSSSGNEQELIDFQHKYKTSVYDKDIIDRHFDKHGIYPETPENSSRVVLYKTPIKTDKDKFEIFIQYDTPYYYNWSGFTKRSFYYYSDDIVYYDFSPASTWSSTKLSFLEIIIEPRNIMGNLNLPKNWNFKKRGNNFYAEVKGASLVNRRLVFAINQRDYKQYQSHIKGIRKYAKISYTLSSPDTLKDDKRSYDPSLAMDGDPKTAWCSSRQHPEIAMKITAGAKSNTVGCYFEGVGLLNGYTKNAEIWSANRRVKSGAISINNDYKASFRLKDIHQKGEFSPYSEATFISDRIPGVVFDEQSSKQYWSMTSSEDATIIIKIDQTYPGTKYQDVCVSEIYPLYNCP